MQQTNKAKLIIVSAILGIVLLFATCIIQIVFINIKMKELQNQKALTQNLQEQLEFYKHPQEEADNNIVTGD